MPKVRLAHLVRQFQSPRIGVCVLVALHVGAALLLQNMAPSIRLPFSSALVKCEVGLLSWWVVLGPSNVVLALSGWVAGMTALLALSIHPFLPVHSGLICLSDAAEFDWAMTLHDCDVIAVLSSPALLVCFFVIERLRWMIRETDSVVCLGRPARSARQLVRRSQFSVGDCLLFLTVVAGSLSVAATLQPYPGWLLDWYKVVQVYILDSHWLLLLGVSAIEMVMTTIAAWWLVLGPGRLLTRCGVFVTMILLCVLLCGPTLANVVTSTAPGHMSTARDMLRAIGEAGPVAAMLAASFLILRLSGCQTATDKSIGRIVPMALHDSGKEPFTEV